MIRLFLLLLFSAIVSVAQAQYPTAEHYSQLKPHPRLILRSDDVARLKQAVDTSPQMARLDNYILTRADKEIEKPVVVYKKQGKRLLSVSRQVLERVLLWSYAYLVTDDVSYAQRAEKEMLASAAFENWNPSHFLDVAEMTTALALGYDWLYDVLSEQAREVIAQAILQKGILGAENERQMWFYKSNHNWNQVCNCGMALGALAIAEREPELAAKMVEKSLLSNGGVMKTYAPDGVYYEGSGYWSYGTWFEVVMIEALRSALGHSFDLEKSEGFLQSADFVNFMTAPSGRTFNYSDCGSSIKKSQNPLLGWFAAERGDMGCIYDDFRSLESGEIRIEERRMLPIGMFFLSRCNLSAIEPPSSKIYVGQGEQPIYIYRGGWETKNDTYLATKGGSASLNHGHMDAGSFVYEKDGVRWSIDLGMQNYYSLESKGVKLWDRKQNSQRWDVYRLSAEPHSTLTIKGEKHIVEACVTMVNTFESERKWGVTYDMTELFEPLTKSERTFVMDVNENLTVIDNVISSKPCTIRWTMCTNATAKIVGKNKILLEQAGKRMLLRANSSRHIVPFILSNDPPHSYDAPNPNSCRVGFDVSVRKKVKLFVQLAPVR